MSWWIELTEIQKFSNFIVRSLLEEGEMDFDNVRDWLQDGSRMLMVTYTLGPIAVVCVVYAIRRLIKTENCDRAQVTTGDLIMASLFSLGVCLIPVIYYK